MNLRKVQGWVGNTYFWQLNPEMRRINIERVTSQLDRLMSRGRVQACEIFKSQRLSLTRYLAGSPLKTKGIRQDSVGLPKILTSELRTEIIAGNLQAIRFSITLLSISRGVLGGKPVDLQSIENEPTGSDSITEFELIRFFQSIRSPALSVGTGSWFWTVKAGPNGPSLWYSLVDLLALRGKPELCSSIKFWLGKENGNYFSGWLLSIVERLPILRVALKLKDRKISAPKLRKLSVKDDKESKTRVFAILDWWSQSALKGLHSDLYKILSGLPADCTFDQGKHLDNMSKYSGPHKFHSFDLSSATDRFPISLQIRLLSKLTSPEAAIHWERIMTSEPFSFQGKSVRYRTGQPMGAHSSWAMFALTHHLVVHTAALRAGLVPAEFHNYAILGDDVVIYHDDVATEYKKLILELGVEISEAKTHVSKDTFEFAKRWFHRGHEVSAFPVTGLLEVLKSWPLLVEFLGHQVPMKGFIGPSDFSDPVWSSLGTILSPHKRERNILLKRMKIVLSLPNWWINNPGDLKERVNTLYQAAGVDPPTTTDSSEWIEFFTTQAYNTVREEIAKRGQISVAKAMSWRNAMYDLEDENPGDNQSPRIPSEWIRSVPPLMVIRSMAIQSQTKLDLSTFSLEWETFWVQWRKLELAFLPRLNGIFPERTRDRMSKAQAYLGLLVVAKVTKLSKEQLGSEIDKLFAPEPEVPDFFPF